MAKITISGGAFQDALGNPLALGYLILEPTQDGQINGGGGQLCSGIKITVNLDSSGNVVNSTVIWPTDQLTPTTIQYRIIAYTAQGQVAWGPNYEVITGSSPFNLNTWVPN